MKVYNRHHKDAPPGAVFIGRPSFWGNPFVLGEDGDREEVLAKYAAWLEPRLKDTYFRSRLALLAEASGLVCFCAPRPCHGHLLVRAMKRLKYLALEVGDQAQWLSGGSYQFTEPRTIASIVSDPVHGEYAFVEGTTTGIRLQELVLWGG